MVDKQEFILKYIERLSHILQKELPDGKLTLQEMIDKADEIVKKFFCSN